MLFSHAHFEIPLFIGEILNFDRWESYKRSLGVI
jgi:hypothetical protein